MWRGYHGDLLVLLLTLDCVTKWLGPKWLHKNGKGNFISLFAIPSSCLE